MSLISLSEAAERYEKSEESFYTSAFLIKKQKGQHPDWYVIKHSGKALIDTSNYEKWSILERKAWIYSTDDLYYILTYDFGFTDAHISRFMSRHSRKFTNPLSWSSFITKTLFSLPQSSILSKRMTMTQEFCYIASYMISVAMNEEKYQRVVA